MLQALLIFFVSLESRSMTDSSIAQAQCRHSQSPRKISQTARSTHFLLQTILLETCELRSPFLTKIRDVN